MLDARTCDSEYIHVIANRVHVVDRGRMNVKRVTIVMIGVKERGTVNKNKTGK